MPCEYMRSCKAAKLVSTFSKLKRSINWLFQYVLILFSNINTLFMLLMVLLLIRAMNIKVNCIQSFTVCLEKPKNRSIQLLAL